MNKSSNRTNSAKDSANSARTTAKRYKYYRIINGRCLSDRPTYKCDATPETAAVIREYQNIHPSYDIDFVRISYQRHCDYLIRRGRVYLIDEANNSLIPMD